MATEEKRMIHGVQVVFPCKPYPSQFSMMEKVIKGIERRQNCLLESPTGSGKSLALLCSALAWQTAEYEKKMKEGAAAVDDTNNCTCCKGEVSSSTGSDCDPENSIQDMQAEPICVLDDDDDFKDSSKPFKTGINTDKPKRSHQSIAYETTPLTDAVDNGEMENGTKDCCSCSSKATQIKTRKVPKIYFGTRTHKQITQIVRELRKTAYREAKMTVLGSRDHACVHPTVSKMKSRNDGCKELLDGPGCKFNDKVKKVFTSQQNVKDLGLREAWDLEDLVEFAREKSACPYFGSRSLRKDADIVFCPYNYLIDPTIRDAMEINLKEQVIILDEAHNIEDAAREAASQTIKSDELEKAIQELDEMISNDIKTPDHLRIRQMCYCLVKFMQDNEASLEQQSYEQAYRCWSGYDIVARMDQLGIGPKHFPEIQSSCSKIKDTEDDPIVKNHEGMEVKLSKTVLQTLESISKVLDYLYRDNLKFVPDYRVAIVKSTSYVSNKFTDNSWLSSRKNRGTKAVPVAVNSINFWCMNPGVAFSDFIPARNVVLTSGTLSPMSSFESELGVPFPIKLEANHVIEDKQVWIGAVGQGPKGGSLTAVYKTMETLNFQDELGELVLKVCQKVPHGVLVFLPSYRALQKFTERWQSTEIWSKILKKKKIFTEPRASEKIDFDCLMKDFYDTIECTQDDEVDGALFLAVCRGKVSEGLDFADNNARAVITVGIPFPNFKDIQVKLKREYNDIHKNARGLLSGAEWYEIQAYRALNQALGRCIRHRKDWGALILADERFVRDGPKYCKGLSKWMRNRVKPFRGFFMAMDSLTTFTEDRIKDMPKVDPNASFIPGTPITHEQTTDHSRLSLSPFTSTPIAKPTFDSKRDFSIFTPIKPSKQTTNIKGSNKQDTSQSGYSVLSPTQVRNDQNLLQASQSQQVIQAPNRQQSSSVLASSVGAGPGSILGPAYNQILQIMNSKLVPQDKPYYVMLNEGTPQQQMFLIQPTLTNQQGSSNQKTGQIMSMTVKKEASPTLPSLSGLRSILPKQLSDSLNIGNQNNTVLSTTSDTNITDARSSAIGQNCSKQSTCSNQSNDRSSDNSMLGSGSDANSSNTSKFFKFCKLPENSSDNIDSEQDISKEKKAREVSDRSERPITPNLFDADKQDANVKSETEVTGHGVDNNGKKECELVCDKTDTENLKKGKICEEATAEKCLARKPIFRRKSTVEVPSEPEICDDSSDNDFKVSANKRKSLTTDVEEVKEEDVDEPLKTRRRGTKRKAIGRSNSCGKRSKGIDFIDDIDESKENQPAVLSSIVCGGCDRVLVPAIKETAQVAYVHPGVENLIQLGKKTGDFEKRRRSPSFMKGVSGQRNTEVIYTVVNKTDQLSCVEMKVQGITVNSTWVEDEACCVQYLRCRGCCNRTRRKRAADILGVRVVSTSGVSSEYHVGQTWLLASCVRVTEMK